MAAMHVPYGNGLAEGKAAELERYMEIYDQKTFTDAVTALVDQRTIESSMTKRRCAGKSVDFRLHR